jgi:hypothetical protein
VAVDALAGEIVLGDAVGLCVGVAVGAKVGVAVGLRLRWVLAGVVTNLISAMSGKAAKISSWFVASNIFTVGGGMPLFPLIAYNFNASFFISPMALRMDCCASVHFDREYAHVSISMASAAGPSNCDPDFKAAGHRWIAWE